MLVNVDNSISIYEFIEVLNNHNYKFHQDNKGNNYITKKEEQNSITKVCTCGKPATVEIQGMYFCSNCYMGIGW